VPDGAPVLLLALELEDQVLRAGAMGLDLDRLMKRLTGVAAEGTDGAVPTSARVIEGAPVTPPEKKSR